MANEQEEFEFRRRAEAEAAVRKPTPKPAPARGDAESIPESLGRAAKNLIPSAGKLVVDTAKSVNALNEQYGLPSSVRMLTNPRQEFAKRKELAAQQLSGLGKVAGIATGGIQRVRELSPGGQRGSAPAMDTKAFDAVKAGVIRKYGTPRRAASTFADDPAPAVAALIPWDRAIAGAGALAKTAKATGSDALAARAARKALPEALKAEAATTAGNVRTAALADVAADTAKLPAVERRVARRAAYEERVRTLKSQAEAAATPPAPSGGIAREPSVVGGEIRKAATGKEAAINTRMREADAKVRTAMDTHNAEQAAAGKGALDTPEGQTLLARSREIVNPDPVTRPTVGRRRMSDTGLALHKRVLETLEPQTTLLTAEQAAQRRALGLEVLEKDGQAYTVSKPDFDTLDDLGRYLGQVRNGEIEAFKGINVREAADLQEMVRTAQDAYVKGMPSELRRNWRQGKQELAKYEKIKTGQKITGLQPGTEEFARPAANLVPDIIAGGRDTVRQAIDAAGPEPVWNGIANHVQPILENTKTSAALNAKFGPGTKLGEVVGMNDDLSAAVKTYMDRVKASEVAGESAKALEARLTRSQARSASLDKMAEQLNQNVAKNQRVANTVDARLAELSAAKADDILPQYSKMMREARVEGRITQEAYDAALERAARAEADFKRTRDFKQFRNTLLEVGGGALAGTIIAGPVGGIAGASAPYLTRRVINRALNK